MHAFLVLGCALALSIGCHRGALAPAPLAGSGELTLEVTPTLSGSRPAVLRSGDEVASGDGIQIAVKPTSDAHVYVAYCDGTRRLTFFPREGSIAALAGTITYIPSKDGRVTLDDQVGPEVLYVIASRRPLDVADPELVAALSRARPDTAVECGEPLEPVIHGDAQRVTEAGVSEQPEVSSDPSVLPAAPPAARPAMPGVASPRLAETPHPVAPPRKRAQSRPPPPVTLERGAFVRWGPAGNVAAGGDRENIVVLRYSFRHVARRAP